MKVKSSFLLLLSLQWLVCIYEYLLIRLTTTDEMKFNLRRMINEMKNSNADTLANANILPQPTVNTGKITLKKFVYRTFSDKNIENDKNNKNIENVKNNKNIENTKNNKNIENTKNNKNIENNKNNKNIENNKNNENIENDQSNESVGNSRSDGLVEMFEMSPVCDYAEAVRTEDVFSVDLGDEKYPIYPSYAIPKLSSVPHPNKVHPKVRDILNIVSEFVSLYCTLYNGLYTIQDDELNTKLLELIFEFHPFLGEVADSIDNQLHIGTVSVILTYSRLMKFSNEPNMETLSSHMKLLKFQCRRPPVCNVGDIKYNIYYVYDLRKSDDTLVGIEPNPGPNNYDFIISCVKNTEKYERLAAVSASKRQQCNHSLSSILDNKHRNKSRDIHMRVERSLKEQRIQFAAEGLFNVGIDNESRVFLTQLAETLSMIIPNKIDLKVDLFSSVTDFMMSLFEQIKKAGRFVLELVSFALLAVRDFCSQRLKDILDIIHPAPMTAEAGTAGMMFTMLAHRKYLKQYISEMDFKGILEMALKARSVNEVCEDVLRPFISIVSNVVNFLAVSLGYDPLMKIEFSADEKLNQFYERFVELRTQYRNGQANSILFAESIFLLQDDLEHYIQYTDPKSASRDKLLYLIGAMKPLLVYTEDNINPNNGPRAEPVGIMIAGPSGVGKSTFTMPILLAIMARTIDPALRDKFLKNHNDFIFFRANENEFWDGYKRGHLAVVYDDFGQRRDTAGTPNPDAFEIIRMVNTAPYHMHFSGIADKSKHYAAPKIVFATSNRQTLHFQSIENSEALMRRFHFTYVQVPKKEYCIDLKDDESIWSRRLDMTKVRTSFPFDINNVNSYVPLDVVEFVPWDFSKGCIKAGEVIGFNQLVSQCVAAYNELHTKSDHMLAFHGLIKKSNFSAEAGVSSFLSYFKKEEEEDNEVFYDAIDNEKQARIDWANAVINKIDSVIFPQSLNLRKATDYISSNLGKFFAGAVTLALVFRGISNAKEYFKLTPNTVSGQKTYNTRPTRKVNVRSKKRTPAYKVKRGNRLENSLRGESGTSCDLSREMAVLKRNVYRLSLANPKNPELGDYFGYATFVNDTVMICNRHFDSFISSNNAEERPFVVNFTPIFNDKISFAIDWYAPEHFEYESGDFDPLLDLLIIRLDSRVVRSHKNIIDAFAPKSAFEPGNQYSSYIPLIRGNQLIFHNVALSIGDDAKYVVDNGEEFKSSLLRYCAPSVSGDCGSLITSSDGKLGGTKIFGYHTAGGTTFNLFKGVTKYCVGVAISREMLTEAVKSLYEEGEEIPITEDLNFEAESGLLHNNIEIDYSTENPSCKTNISSDGFNHLAIGPKKPGSGKTKIQPSLMYGQLWDITTKVAHLRKFTNTDGNCVDPLSIAKNKYAHDEKYVSQHLLDRAMYLAQQLVLKKSGLEPWNPRILTVNEVIDGIPGEEFVNAIDRTTSAGFPYSNEIKSVGKKHWIGEIGTSQLAPGYNRIVTDVMNILDNARKGIRILHLYTDFPKDERRPIAKVDAGKTRQISGSPLDYTICFKMYFGDAIRSFMMNRVNNSMAIGVNPYEEWSSVKSFLMDHDKPRKVVAGDYSGYDTKLRATVMWRVLDIFERYYYNSTAEDRLIRKVLWHDVVNSIHINNGEIYEYNGSQASGFPGTGPCNSIANVIILMCAICAQVPEEQDDRILQNVSVMTFGDDNLVSFTSDFYNYCNQDSLGKTIFDLFGMEYTSETKDGTIKLARDIHEVNFLKRGFRFEKSSNTYLAPLELAVIKETLNWQKNTSLINEITQRIDAVLFELSLHGEKVFNELAPTIVGASIKCYGYNPVNATYRNARLATNGLGE